MNVKDWNRRPIICISGEEDLIGKNILSKNIPFKLNISQVKFEIEFELETEIETFSIVIDEKVEHFNRTCLITKIFPPKRGA